MTCPKWFRWLFTRRATRPAKRNPGRCLAMEALEDRVVPATQLTFSSFDDMDPNWKASTSSTLIAYRKHNGSGDPFSAWQIGGVNSTGGGEGFLATGVNLALNGDSIGWLGNGNLMVFAEAKNFHENMRVDMTGVTTAAPANRSANDGIQTPFDQVVLNVAGGRNSGAFQASRNGNMIAWRDAPNSGGPITVRTAPYPFTPLGQSTNAFGSVIVSSASDGTVGARGMALTPTGHGLVISLAVKETDAGQSTNTGYDLWFYPINTATGASAGPRTRLTSTGLTNQNFNGAPDISPNGTEILFSGTGAGGASDVFKMPLAGGTPVNLTNSATISEAQPSWSPTGTQYAFARHDGNWNIWIDNITPPNSPPSITSVSLTPTTAFETSTLTATPQGVNDPDGNTVTFSYQWFVNGSPIGPTSSTLTGANFSKGNTVFVRVTPNDGTVNGTPVDSNTVTILNSAPSITSVNLTPTTAFETSTLTATPSGTSDADGDTVSFSYQWFVNGSPIGPTSSPLTGANFSKGNTVFVRVTPSDGTASGSPVQSNTVTIQNSPPSTPSDSNTTSPDQVEENASNGTLVGIAAFATDADGDTITYTLTDSAGGRFAIDAVTGVVTLADDNMLNYESASSHQITVQASDGMGGTSNQTFTISVENVAPTVPTALAFSTYLGGSGTEEIRASTVDAAGNTYVTGVTTSANFPATVGANSTTYHGLNDGFVAKFDPAGALVWATLLGGSGDDIGQGIAFDAAGNVFVTGQTSSGDFPVTAGAAQPTYGGGQFDAFVAKLSAAGAALLYSTYIGGDDADYGGQAIALDASGNAYITGETRSANFPTMVGAFQTSRHGLQDAFVTKLNANGTGFVYSTYLGGSGTAFNEDGFGIAVDPVGNAVVVGRTDSTDFPTTGGALHTTFGGGVTDAFVTKLNANGTGLIYSTLLGGSGSDEAVAVLLDAAGNAYLEGSTSSSNFPTANAFQATYGGGASDIFVSKLNPTGAGLVYSTFLGGSGADHAHESATITRDTAGNLYVAGYTTSLDYPTTANAPQADYGGGNSDGVVSVLNSSGNALSLSTYGGEGGEERFSGIGLDANSAIHVAGWSSSSGFPVVNAFQSSNAGGKDALLLKIDQVFAVLEGAANGTLVGLDVFSADPNGPPVTFSLTDDADGRFAIHPSTGVVTVANGTMLNTTLSLSHNITVQASDDFATSTAHFTIQVLSNRMSLANDTLFGGPGDQRGRDIAIGNGILSVVGNNEPESQSSADSSFLYRYDQPITSGSTPSSTTFHQGILSGVALADTQLYAVGHSHPTEASPITTDAVGGAEIKPLIANYSQSLIPPGGGPSGSNWATTVPNAFQLSSATSYFQYAGVEMHTKVITTQEGPLTVLYAAGWGQVTGSASAYVLAKYTSGGTLVGAATDSSVGINFGVISSPAGSSDAQGLDMLGGNIFVAGSSGWDVDGGVSRATVWIYNSSLALQSRQQDINFVASLYGGATVDNAFYAVGQRILGPDTDFLIQKYNADGTRAWTSAVAYPGLDVLTDVIGLNGRVFAVGHSTSFGAGDRDAVLVEIDPTTGNFLSITRYGGAQADAFNTIATDGTDLYAVGETRSFASGDNAIGQNDVVVVKYTVSGSTVPASTIDFGDAPDLAAGSATGDYKTTLADNGPRHLAPGPRFGPNRDSEADATPTIHANGDDIIGSPDDEDGLVNPSVDLIITAGTVPEVRVWVHTPNGSARVTGWIDYNRDGVFDNNTERTSFVIGSTGQFASVVQTLIFPAVPLDAVGKTYARFRISTDQLAVFDPFGPAADGEVEDYVVNILAPTSATVSSVTKIASNTNGLGTLENEVYFGFTGVPLGDLDGDGVTELVVSSVHDNTGGPDTGALYVLFMNGNGTVKSNVKIADSTNGLGALGNDDNFGDAVANLGDLDGDGVNDLAIGAIGDDTGLTNTGAVHILFMNANGTVKTHSKIASGSPGFITLPSDYQFGEGIANMGDMDGDGVTDIAVGAGRDDTGGTYRGAVYILFLNSNGTVKSHQQIAHQTGGFGNLANNDQFGLGLANIGDLDSDGVTDLAASAYGENSHTGSVYILFMNANGTVKATQKIGHQTGGFGNLTVGDHFGFYVNHLGDIDGNGTPEISVTAYQDDTGGANRGAVYVLSLNANGTVAATQKIAHQTGGFGSLANGDALSSAYAIGDLNGDGRLDLAIGANGDDTGGLDRGALYIVNLGASPTLDYNATLNPTINAYTLRKNGGNIELVETANPTNVLQSQPYASLTTVNITGQNSINDTLTVDYAFGGYFALANGIAFSGGTAGNDRLAVVGNGTTSAVYTPSASTPSNGVVAVNGSTSITFTGLEPVDITGMANATLTLPNSHDVLTIQNGTDFTQNGSHQALRVSGTSNGVAIETAAFWNNTNLTIGTAAVDGNDSITITSANNTHGNGNLHISTGANSDVINVNGEVLVTGNLFMQSAVINLSANLRTDGGDVEILGILSTNLNRLIDTSQTPGQSGGDIDVDQAFLTASAGGANWNLDTSTSAGGQAGNVRLGDVNDAGAGFVRPEGLSVNTRDDAAPHGILLLTDGNNDGIATINVDGGGVSFSSASVVQIASGVRVAIDTFESNPFNTPGSVTFTDVGDTLGAMLNGSSAGNEQLTIDTTGNVDGVVRLPRIGNLVRLGGVQVITPFPIELHGDISTQPGTAPLGGNVTLSNTVFLTQNEIIDTDGGAVEFSGAAVASNGVGPWSLTLDANAATPGRISLGTLSNDNGNGTLVNNLTAIGGNLTLGSTSVAGAIALTLTGPSTLTAPLAIQMVTGLSVNSLGAASTGFISGAISGAGGVIKNGNGTLTLSGNNTYTGVTTVNAGALLVNGTLANGPSATDVVVAANATLGGNGTIAGAVNVGGILAPGSSAGVLGTGNLTFAANSTFSAELGGTNAGQFDQAAVSGNVTIGSNVSLNLSAVNAFAPGIGNSFTIISNDDGSDAVVGTFLNLPEGAILTNFLGTGLNATITYAGGPGNNDVILTVLAPVNQPPVVTPANGTLAFTENDTAKPIDATFVVSDIDSANLVGATITFTAGYVNGQDTLGFVNQNGINGSFSAGNGTLTLAGSATLANYQAALRSVTYFNGSEAPSTANRTLSIVVNDGSGVNNLSAPASRIITVTAVNDNAPTIDVGQSFVIAENSANGTAVGSVSATDIDGATTLQGWTITGGNPGDAFAINVGNGSITVNNGTALDREALAGFTLQVRVSDGVNNSPVQNVTIQLNDVNDVTPVVTANQSFAINENSANGTIVGTVIATDGDVSNTTLQSWTITGGNPGNAFAINAGNGSISVANSTALDREAVAGFTLQVRVSDGVNNSPVQNMTIQLNDVNDMTPVVTANQSFAINENSANGTVVGTVLATDGDVSNTTLQGWTITGGNPDDAFAINAGNGSITVNNGTALDREAVAGFTLQVRVSDGVNLSPVQNVTIQLNDVNDVTPVVTANQSFAINENSANGTIVGTVIATDGDVSNTTLQGWTIGVGGLGGGGLGGGGLGGGLGIGGVGIATLLIISGNLDGAFAINPSTGVITVANSGVLDREAAAGFELQITVSDGVNTSVPALVTIMLNDLNDVAPVVTANQTFAVDENSANGTVVGTAVATDGDVSATSFHNWSITGGNPGNAFAIAGATGQITVNNSAAVNVGAFSLQVTVSDSLNVSSAQTVTIHVNDVNTEPSLTPANGTLSYVENMGATIVDAGFVVSDDGVALMGAVFRFTGGYMNGQDVLSFTNQSGITGSFNAGNGTLTLSGNATLAAYQTALRSVTYTNNSDNPSTANRTLSIVVSDVGLTSPAVSRTITVAAVNDAPTATPANGTLPYTENDGAATLDSAIVVSDADSAMLASAAVVFTGGYVSGQDVLSFANQNGITGAFTPANGTLSLSGLATVADYQTALRSITYTNNSDNPTTSNRTLSVVVHDGLLPSAAVHRTITVAAVNDAPVLTPAGGVLDYTENAGPIALDNSFVVSDVDSSSLASASVTFSGGYVNGHDILSAAAQGGVSVGFNAANGTLTLSGNASLATYQSVLRSITYTNTSDAPSTANRTLAIVVRDTAGVNNLSTAVTRTISVTPVNDAPTVVTSASNATFAIGGAAVAIDTGLTLADVDSPNLAGATVSIATNFTAGQDVLGYTNQNGINGTYHTANGTLTLTGVASLADYQTALRSVTYFNTNSTPFQFPRTILFQVNDGADPSNIASRNLAFSNPNNNPPVLSPVANQTLSYAAPLSNVTLNATDPDNNPLSYSAAIDSVGHYLRSTYNLTLPAGNLAGLTSGAPSAANLYYNFGGKQDKWLASPDGWYIILPNGDFYKWSGHDNTANMAAGFQMLTVNPVYWQDPGRIRDEVMGEGPIDFSVSGNQLIFENPTHFEGQFRVIAAVSDGIYSDSKSFFVNFTNVAPTLEPIANQTMPPTQDTITVPLVAADPESDSFNLSATLQSQAQIVKADIGSKQPATLGMLFDESSSFNYGRIGDKWLSSRDSVGNKVYYYLLPTGDLFRWDGTSSVAQGTFIANVGTNIYATPSLLINPINPPATTSIAGSNLTVDPAASFRGTLVVTARATDTRGNMTTRVFTVTVAPAPTLTQPVNINITGPTETPITLNATDPSGLLLTYSVVSEALLLKTTYNLSFTGNLYLNYLGLGEKWLRGAGPSNQVIWYYITPAGQLFRYQTINGNPIGQSTFVRTIDTRYHTNPALLYNAHTQAAFPTLPFTGNTFTVKPSVGFTGTLVFTVYANNGVFQDNKTFVITVS